MNASLPKRHDNSIRTIVVTNSEQMSHAFSIRSICFMEEGGLKARHAFDGNDFQATHFVVYADDEPIGAARVRWFNGFAKIERTAFRKAYRNTRVITAAARFIFEHAAKKGYSTVLTFAEEQYARIWIKILGFTPVTGTYVSRPNEERRFLELTKTIDVPPDAITAATPARILIRTEGGWDVPASFG